MKRNTRKTWGGGIHIIKNPTVWETALVEYCQEAGLSYPIMSANNRILPVVPMRLWKEAAKACYRKRKLPPMGTIHAVCVLLGGAL